MDYIVFKSFLPEIFLCTFLLILLFFNALVVNNIKNNFPIINKEIFYQCFFLLICVFFLFLNNKLEGFFVNFLFLNDFSSKIIKILIVLFSFTILLALITSFSIQKLNFPEYFILFLFSLFSSLLIVSSVDMLSFYLIIEMQSLCFYVLACFKRNSAFSTEAGLKYFISGSFISGIFLLGCSLIYGVLGTLNFNNLFLLLSLPFENHFSLEYLLILVGVLLITFVFLFKISAAPFHFWTPDVYEGAPLSSTIIFSIVPKLSIFFLFLKWLSIVSLIDEIKIVLFISGIFSVFIGSFFALTQKRFKRFLIYSSISQIGFLVIALSDITINSFIGIFFFLLIYIITSILIWSIVSLFFSFQNKISFFESKLQFPLFISSLSSFFFINKIWSFSNIFIFFSLAGIPPLVGFFAKILILFSVIESKNIILSFLLIIISALSVFYYLRIIKIIFFEKKQYSKLFFAQIIFRDYYLDHTCFLISLFLFLLVFLFFYPSFLLVICNLIAFTFYFF